MTGLAYLSAVVAALLAVAALFSARSLAGPWLVEVARRQAGLLIETFNKAACGGRLTRPEHGRIAVGSVLTVLVLGSFAIGPEASLVVAAVAPWVVLWLAKWRYGRYCLAVEKSLPQLAATLSTVLASGTSLIYGLREAASSATGPIGRELTLVTAELELGASVDAALDRFRVRVGSAQVDAFVAALQVQRQVGGNLVTLLREIASAGEEQQRLEGEVSAASAQARFTALIVVGLPVVATLLGELIFPGFLAGLFSNFIAVWLVGLSFVMQLAGFAVIRKVVSQSLKGR